MFNVLYVDLEGLVNRDFAGIDQIFRKSIAYEKIPTFKIAGNYYFNMEDETNKKIFKIVNVLDTRKFDLKADNFSNDKIDFIAFCIEDIPSKADRVWND